MPQFDQYSFLIQMFWLFTTFIAFYILVLIFLSQGVGRIIKFRNKLKAKLAHLKSLEKGSDTNKLVVYNQIMKAIFVKSKK